MKVYQLAFLGLSLPLTSFAANSMLDWDLKLSVSGPRTECDDTAQKIAQELRAKKAIVVRSECYAHNGTTGWIVAEYKAEDPIYTHEVTLDVKEWKEADCLAAKAAQKAIYAQATKLNPLAYSCSREGKAKIVAFGESMVYAHTAYIQEWMANDATQGIRLLGGVPAVVGTSSAVYYNSGTLKIGATYFGYFNNGEDCLNQINELANMQRSAGDRLVNPQCREIPTPKGSFFSMETLRVGSENFLSISLRDMVFEDVPSCLANLPSIKAAHSRREERVIGGLCIPDTIDSKVRVDLFY